MSDSIAEAQIHAEDSRRAVDSSHFDLKFLEQRQSARPGIARVPEKQQRQEHEQARRCTIPAKANLNAIQSSTSRSRSARNQQEQGQHGLEPLTADEVELREDRRLHEYHEKMLKAFREDPLPAEKSDRPQSAWEDLIAATSFVTTVARKLIDMRTKLSEREDRVAELKAMVDIALDVGFGKENKDVLFPLYEQLLQAQSSVSDSRNQCADYQSSLAKAEESQATACSVVEAETQTRKQNLEEAKKNHLERTAALTHDPDEMEETIESFDWGQEKSAENREHDDDDNNDQNERVKDPSNQEIADIIAQLQETLERGEREMERMFGRLEQSSRKAKKAMRDAYFAGVEQVRMNEVLHELAQQERERRQKEEARWEEKKKEEKKKEEKKKEEKKKEEKKKKKKEKLKEEKDEAAVNQHRGRFLENSELRCQEGEASLASGSFLFFFS